MIRLPTARESASCSPDAQTELAPPQLKTQAPRPPKRAVNGILLLDKPADLSSNGALQRVRRSLAAAKGGHTGNLDVAATGLLPLCFGEATKVSAFLLDADKVYVADIALGVTTSTGDREGEITRERPVPSLTQGDLESVLTGFLGEQSQIPPMYSALKRNGRPLYEYARAGIELERTARRINLYALRLVAQRAAGLVVEVHCSKGTYVRTLAEDIGEALGCGAHLSGLRRTRAGPFRLEDAYPIERFEAGAADPASYDSMLLPIDRALGAFPALTLDPAAVRAVSYGQRVGPFDGSKPGLCRLYAHDGRFLGIADVDLAGVIAPRRMMQTLSGSSDPA